MNETRKETSALKQVKSLWRRRKWLAIGVFALIFCPLAALVLTLPSLYQTSTTVLVNPGATAGGPGAATAADNGVDLRIAAISQQVLSRPRLERLIKHYDLYPRLRGSDGSLGGAVARMRHDVRFARTQADQQYGQKATIAFTLSYQGWQPQKVMQVTNALAGLYLQDDAEINQQQAASTTGALQNQLQNITQKLQLQQAKINAFRKQHMGALPEQQDANLRTLDQLNAQLQSNKASQIRIMGLREDMLTHASSSGDQDLTQLKQQLAQLRARYSDQYPEVIRVKAEIAQLEQSGASAGTSQAGANTLQQRLAQSDAQLAALQQQAAGLQPKIADYQARISSLPLVQQQMQALTQGYAQTEAVYAKLLTNFEQARLAGSALDHSSHLFQVIDTAAAPVQPFAPSRLRLLLVCLVLGLVVAAAVVYFSAQFDPSLHSADEVQNFAGIPVLITIPRIVTAGDRWRRRLRVGVMAAITVVVLAVAVGIGYQIGHGDQQLVWRLAKHAQATVSQD